jgi:hypothetical protein
LKLQWWFAVAWGITILLPGLFAAAQALSNKHPPKWLGARRSDYRCYAIGTIMLALGPFIAIYLSLALDEIFLAPIGGVIWVAGAVLRAQRPRHKIGAEH